LYKQFLQAKEDFSKSDKSDEAAWKAAKKAYDVASSAFSKAENSFLEEKRKEENSKGNATLVPEGDEEAIAPKKKSK